MLKNQHKDLDYKLCLEERLRILTREIDQHKSSGTNLQNTQGYRSDSIVKANSEKYKEICMHTNSLNFHVKYDGITKDNIKNDSAGEISLTCSGENILRNSKKILKENKDENTEKGTNTVIANTTCTSYTEVTKKGLDKNDKLWKKQNI